MIFSRSPTLLASHLLSALAFCGCSDQKSSSSDLKSDVQEACRSDVETAIAEAQRAGKSEAEMKRAGDAALFRCLARKQK